MYGIQCSEGKVVVATKHQVNTALSGIRYWPSCEFLRKLNILLTISGGSDQADRARTFGTLCTESVGIQICGFTQTLSSPCMSWSAN